MAAPKLAKDIEGDSPEHLAWGLLEWIGMVEDVRNRTAILDAYGMSLAAVRTGAGMDEGAEPQPATGIQRRLAYKLAHLVAEMEGRDPGQRNQGDRAWILENYAECLEAVMGRRRLGPVASAVESQASEVEVEAVAAA
jgi:hypothetical protein